MEDAPYSVSKRPYGVVEEKPERAGRPRMRPIQRLSLGFPKVGLALFCQFFVCVVVVSEEHPASLVQFNSKRCVNGFCAIGSAIR